MSETLKIASGAALLNVRIDGDESLPWLVLSNSLGADMSMWEPQVDAFTRHRRVVRYDTRGHGASSAPPGPYDFAGLVADVVAILDRLEIAQADVVGLSLGGMTALGLGLARPDRVRRLVCCDARAEFPEMAIAGWSQRMESVAAGGVEAIVEETLTRWFTATTFCKRPDIISHARDMMCSTSVAGYLGCVSALKGLDYRRHLPGLTVPALYLTGSDDGAAPPDVVRDMAAATPRAEFFAVPAAAHISNLEAPEVFNRRVLAFLTAPEANDDAVARL